MASRRRAFAFAVAVATALSCHAFDTGTTATAPDDDRRSPSVHGDDLRRLLPADGGS